MITTVTDLYEQDKKEIQKFLKKHREFSCYVDGDMLYIQNPIEKWFIRYSKQKDRFLLYHENHNQALIDSPDKDYEYIPGYHVHLDWPVFSVSKILRRIFDHLNNYVAKNIPSYIRYQAKKMISGSDITAGRKSKKRKKLYEEELRKEREAHKVLELLNDIGEKTTDEQYICRPLSISPLKGKHIPRRKSRFGMDSGKPRRR